jgi:uncharacterized membrane protein
MKARSCFWQRSMASAVEMVEALTIVVAVGVTRGWRAALAGVGAATVTLAVVVAVLGRALHLRASPPPTLGLSRSGLGGVI